MLQGVDVAGSTGALTVTANPAGTPVGTTTVRGGLVQGSLTGPSVGQVVGSGALAAGLSALQSTVVTEGDDRAATATACQAPHAELWLVGGGGGSTRRERVVLSNPGANTVTADVTVLGLVRNPPVGQRPERRRAAPGPHQPARRCARGP